MRSPAAAMAWELRSRHRWGFLALGAYVAELLFVRLLNVNVENEMTFAFVMTVPLAAALLYLLAIFSFGLSGDVAARRSMYPARMFTLPVTTASLVTWPMIYGSLTMALVWFASRLLGVWPAKVHVPIVWPALLAAALLAWTQALTWMPYALPGLRVIVTVLWLATIDAIIMIALNVRASEAAMLAIIVPQLPLAWLVAHQAVRRARTFGAPAPSRPVRRLPAGWKLFRSAQAWLEWHQHGRSLPTLTAILLPCEAALLFLFPSYPGIVLEIMIAMLFTPPLLALFVAPTVSGALTPFIATRPVTDTALIAAKLTTAMRSALAAFLLTILAIPIAAQLSGTAPILTEKAHQLAAIFGPPRAAALTLIVLAAVAGSTWKQLVQSLCVGMSGREGLVKASVFIALAFVAVAVPAGHWMFTHDGAIGILWSAFPWIVSALVCLKLGLAGWIALRLRERHLISDRTLIAAAALWDVAVLAVFGVLRWIFPPLIIRTWVLVVLAILVVPLARVSAAPLALAWNRHR